MTENLIRVFVYGTLKPGEINHALCATKVVEVIPAIALGQLFSLPLGYPAMTPGVSPVYGFVLSFTDASILALLDEFEQHDPTTFIQQAPEQVLAENQYQRQQIPVFTVDGQALGTAWTYLMTLKQIDHLNGVWLPDGLWSSEQAALTKYSE